MFREIKPQEIQDNPFELIGKEWLLVAANKDGKKQRHDGELGGAVGEMWGKSVVMIVIRPQRYTKTFLDQTETFSLGIFPGNTAGDVKLHGNGIWKDRG